MTILMRKQYVYTLTLSTFFALHAAEYGQAQIKKNSSAASDQQQEKVVLKPQHNTRYDTLLTTLNMVLPLVMCEMILGYAPPENQPLNTWFYTNVNRLIPLSADIFALGRTNSTITLWDKTGKTRLRTLHGHTRDISALVLVSQEYFASGDSGGTIKLWNANTTECVATMKHAHRSKIQALVVLANKYLASCANDGIRTWNIQGKSIEPQKCFREHLESLSIGAGSLAALDPEELAVGEHTGYITLWKVKKAGIKRVKTLGGMRDWKRGRLLPAHVGYVVALAAISTTHLASSGHDGIKIWHVEKSSYTKLGTNPHIGSSATQVTALTVLANGYLLSGHYFGSINVWNIKHVENIVHEDTFHGDGRPINILTGVPTGTMVSGSFIKLKRGSGALVDERDNRIQLYNRGSLNNSKYTQETNSASTKTVSKKRQRS